MGDAHVMGSRGNIRIIPPLLYHIKNKMGERLRARALSSSRIIPTLL